MRTRSWLGLAAIACVACVACSSTSGGGSPSDAATDNGPGGGCPFSLTVDGTTYNAITCQGNGVNTVASGLYQFDLAAQFSNAAPNIRSIALTIRDSDTTATATHLLTYDASQSNPGCDATYHETSLDPGWSTLAAGAKVGSGTLTLTKYDRAAKLVSGTFTITALKGTDSKTLTGSFTDMPMMRAD
jgi:hypothetical protein